MAQENKNKNIGSAQMPNRLSAITIEGFKSISTEKKLELSSLNILAGANSSGKSSFIQPLLLLKQTLEATYDPGPLLINGPNVKFTELSQIFSKSNQHKQLQIGLIGEGGQELTLQFDLDDKKLLRIKENTFLNRRGKLLKISESTTTEELLVIAKEQGDFPANMLKNRELQVSRERAFLRVSLLNEGRKFVIAAVGDRFGDWIGRNIIHVPGLRGNPERSYPKTSVGSNYPGTLDSYVASIIADWQDHSDPRLGELGMQLQKLGLTWKVIAKKVDDTRVELQVGRLPIAAQGGGKDLVSIADVGFGVSQVLPVLVALLVVNPGQVVYIEQPETHLHPKAQRALAGIFAEAALRQSTVIVETHSLIFVRAVQTLVAKKQLDKQLVKLHWVERDVKGNTTVTTSDLDDAGAYGSWPQDFEETEMAAEQDYIDAAENALSIHD